MINIYNISDYQADCFLIQFKADNKNEKDEKSKTFNLLIDGGLSKDNIPQKLKDILDDEKIEGMILTHLDNDHISGMIKWVNESNECLRNSFFIFNKFDPTVISYNQAKTLSEKFEAIFSPNKLLKSYQHSFKKDLIPSKSDMLDVRIYSLSQRVMEDSLNEKIINITILGPSEEQIKKFMMYWNDDNKNAEVINQSSIMVLIEFEEKKIVMTGDGNCMDVYEALKQIPEIKKIHVIKAAHHGALENNIKLCNIINEYNVDTVMFTISEQSYENEKKHPNLDLLKQIKNIKSTEITCNCEIDEIGTVTHSVKDEERLCKYIKQKKKIELRG